MPITAEWYLPGRVILSQNIGDVTVDDMMQVDQPLVDLIEAGEAPLVHVIVDCSEMGQAPRRVKTFTETQWPKHDGLGWTIVVALNNRLLEFVAGTAARVLRMRVRFVRTLAEARAFLNDVDSTLPDLEK
jgi:hypothetical protein